MKAWAKEKAEARKRLALLPRCEVPECDGKALGFVYVSGEGAFQVCPRCAAIIRSLELAEKR